MTQICLLDPARLSQLLQNALAWRNSTSSLMVSAANGSILSFAFQEETPGIKDLRTMSTTMTAAYTVASEDILVYEAQITRALSVIIPVGDHILLAVNGPARAPFPKEGTPMVHSPTNGDDASNDRDEDHGSGPYGDVEHEKEQEQVQRALEEVAESLAGTLREELAGLKWPGDI